MSIHIRCAALVAKELHEDVWDPLIPRERPLIVAEVKVRLGSGVRSPHVRLCATSMAMLDLSDPQTLPGTTVPCSEPFRAREAADAPARPATLVDPFGRAITYLRLLQLL